MSGWRDRDLRGDNSPQGMIGERSTASFIKATDSKQYFLPICQSGGLSARLIRCSSTRVVPAGPSQLPQAKNLENTGAVPRFGLVRITLCLPSGGGAVQVGFQGVVSLWFTQLSKAAVDQRTELHYRGRDSTRICGFSPAATAGFH